MVIEQAQASVFLCVEARRLIARRRPGPCFLLRLRVSRLDGWEGIDQWGTTRLIHDSWVQTAFDWIEQA